MEGAEAAEGEEKRRKGKGSLYQLPEECALFFSDGSPIEVTDSVIVGRSGDLGAAFGVGQEGRDAGGE